MKTPQQREAAAETMKKLWQDPAFRARVRAGQQAGRHLRGEAHPNWKGGRRQSGYVWVRVDGRYVPRSHLVWEEAHPDDPIQPGEIIHHVNRIRDDDRPDNLQKLTAPVHASLHHAGRAWSPGHREKALAAMRQTPRRYTVKSCGKAHPSCAICAPERYGEAWRAKIRAGHAASTYAATPEQRAKMSASTKEYWRRRKGGG